jgi:hypothetical protein
MSEIDEDAEWRKFLAQRAARLAEERKSPRQKENERKAAERAARAERKLKEQADLAARKAARAAETPAERRARWRASRGLPVEETPPVVDDAALERQAAEVAAKRESAAPPKPRGTTRVRSVRDGQVLRSQRR